MSVARVDYQEKLLDLMSTCSFNDFDAPAVVADLREHRELWEAAMFTDETECGLILRDLPRTLHFGTIYLRVKKEHVKALERLAKKWHASEFDVNPPANEMAYFDFPKGQVFVRIWWD